jgi:hypothetical protein
MTISDISIQIDCTKTLLMDATLKGVKNRSNFASAAFTPIFEAPPKPPRP